MPGAEFDESEQPILPGEPEGWRELQNRARSARNARELDSVIAEMNRLLAECEKKSAAGQAMPTPSQHGSEKQTSSDE